LNAFVTPTSQIKARSESATAEPVNRIGGSQYTNNAAINTCPTNFVAGLMGRMSSAAPSANISAQQASKGRIGETFVVNPMPSASAPAIATPPSTAIGFRCHRSSVGTAHTPNRTAAERTMGVSAAADAKAIEKANRVVTTDGALL